jgi:hypothetical protein
MLHVTNGDSVASALRRTGLSGRVLPWRDILHEGPVPGGLPLESLSGIRARFLAEQGAGPFEAISADFGARDAALRNARRVVLWFEHDLYDQLQLIQILDTLAGQAGVHCALICIDRFPGVVPFHGLGQLTAPQLAGLWPGRRRIGPSHFASARTAWRAFTSPNAAALDGALRRDLSALPFLPAALRRWREEFPAAPDGLGRTERTALRAIAAGCDRFEPLFVAVRAAEPASFLGDTTLRARLEKLIRTRVPLLTPEPYRLTPAGARVLAGAADARALNGIDRWFGGRHLAA